MKQYVFNIIKVNFYAEIIGNVKFRRFARK